jgi:hypothetical protein
MLLSSSSEGGGIATETNYPYEAADGTCDASMVYILCFTHS